MSDSSRRAMPLALAVGLLLLYFFTRVMTLPSFPPFVDEAFHINFGNLVREQGLFARAEEGRQFTIWLYVAVQSQVGGAPIFVARAATILAILPGIAAAMAAAQVLGGGWSGVLAALLLTFSTFHLFFDRLALADPISASAALVAVYFAARLRVRAHRLDAALCGLALFVAVGAKVSALPYLAVPLAAALTLKPPGRAWREHVRWAGIALAISIGLTTLFLGALILRGVNPFFYLQSPSSAAQGAYLDKLLLVPDTLFGYAGPVMGALLLTGLVVLLVRRQFFLPLLVGAPLLVLALSGRQDSRHIIVPISLILVSAAVAVEWVSLRHALMIRRVALTLVLVWAALVWAPFAAALVSDPLALALTASDRGEYITAEGSGFGLAEALGVLESEGAERVIGVLANCLSLRYSAGDLEVDCPRLNPNGEDVPALEALLEANRQTGVYAILEAIPYAPESAPGLLVATIEGAPGRPLLRVYALGG
ncbi:MAG TPA: hypothetical protein VER79_09255 [Candidatus Limnocylindrales bacterium]|nr:hypothetical protein [Candidatus Limnocylindrales bacterium]